MNEILQRELAKLQGTLAANVRSAERQVKEADRQGTKDLYTLRDRVRKAEQAVDQLADIVSLINFHVALRKQLTNFGRC